MLMLRTRSKIIFTTRMRAGKPKVCQICNDQRQKFKEKQGTYGVYVRGLKRKDTYLIHKHDQKVLFYTRENSRVRDMTYPQKLKKRNGGVQRG